MSVLVMVAHSRLQHSLVNAPLAETARSLMGVTVHDLYEEYPDFFIDAAREQQLLTQARSVVLQFPVQWYSCPALLKEWLDVTLTEGWAYGPGGTALAGKKLLLAVSAGGPEDSYHPSSYNARTMAEFLLPFAQTAGLCGMEYLPFLCFYSAHHPDALLLEAHRQQYRQQLEALVNG
jgi:glutathione-regulated potassium-efflux system ancillary protein KefF